MTVPPPAPAATSLTPQGPDYAFKTWLYLRVAMILLVLGLAVSVVYEVCAVDSHCVRHSISAYYYTPVHSYFVGALVAIGVCLICLRGRIDADDVFLNLAGMCAPVVALVPTPLPSDCCHSAVVGVTNRSAIIDNNVTALLAVALAGLLAVFWLARPYGRHAKKAVRWGYSAAIVMWIAIAAPFAFFDDAFDKAAHLVSAGVMFVFIFAVVVVNAREHRNAGSRVIRNRYTAVTIAMGVAVLTTVAAALLKWDYKVLWIEGWMLGLFAIFWIVQTWQICRERRAAVASGA